MLHTAAVAVCLQNAIATIRQKKPRKGENKPFKIAQCGIAIRPGLGDHFNQFRPQKPPDKHRGRRRNNAKSQTLGDKALGLGIIAIAFGIANQCAQRRSKPKAHGH